MVYLHYDTIVDKPFGSRMIQWEFQDPIYGGTLVPYVWPYELW